MLSYIKRVKYVLYKKAKNMTICELCAPFENKILRGGIMLDRFKFRVWHKKRKKMYEVLHLHVEDDYSNDGPWVTAKGFNIITEQDIHIQIQPKDCLIMQCTGLKDRNDKLIFEGDLLKDNKGQIGNVFWHSSTGSFAINWLMKDGSYETDNCFEYGEVISNKFENPELLESEER